MILETTSENLRDIAAAVSAGLKREPSATVLSQVETKVLTAIQRREEALELDDGQANALRNALLRRAYDQRSNAEGYDYADLAERIERALQDQAIELDEN